jgi:TPR repeat protein
MDFVIAKDDFNTALRQILQGRKDAWGEVVDLTADRTTLTVVATGRSIEVPIVAEVMGSAIVPIKVIFGARRISMNYQDERLRLRISDGKFRIQSMSISNPDIAMKRIARRIIDIPNDASPMDVLALRHIFSVDEIEDSGLHVKVLNAQADLTWCLENASTTLRDYGFEQAELIAMAEAKIKAHAAAIKHIFFENNEVSPGQATEESKKIAENLDEERDSAARWLERGKALLIQEKWHEAQECFVAGLAVEPDQAELRFWMGFLCNTNNIEWFRKAAAHGHAEAAWHMTLHLLKGEILHTTLDEALFWFNQATHVGSLEGTMAIIRERPPSKQSGNVLYNWLCRLGSGGNKEAAFEFARLQYFANEMGDVLEETAKWLEASGQTDQETIKETIKKFRAERRSRQCELAVNSGDKLAFLYAEWADRSLFLKYDADMYTEEWIDNYRKLFPDKELGTSEWWWVPGGPDYTQPLGTGD